MAISQIRTRGWPKTNNVLPKSDRCLRHWMPLCAAEMIVMCLTKYSSPLDMSSWTELPGFLDFHRGWPAPHAAYHLLTSMIEKGDEWQLSSHVVIHVLRSPGSGLVYGGVPNLGLCRAFCIHTRPRSSRPRHRWRSVPLRRDSLSDVKVHRMSHM